jgi:DNA invertase Pin-like site-specific DNA recombinase
VLAIFGLELDLALHRLWNLLAPGASVRAASRANGTKFGRPRKVADSEHIATAKRMKADGRTGKDIAKYLGVSRATLYWYLTEDTAA